MDTQSILVMATLMSPSFASPLPEPATVRISRSERRTGFYAAVDEATVAHTHDYQTFGRTSTYTVRVVTVVVQGKNSPY